MTITEISSILTIVAAVAAAITAYLNKQQIHEVRISINGRLDALLKTTSDLAHTKGVIEGRGLSVAEATQRGDIRGAKTE